MKHTYLMPTVGLLCTLFFVWSCQVSKKVSDAKPITHELWTELLHKHVDDDGWVDYPGFVKDTVKLNQYLAKLSNAHPNDTFWSEDEQLAYWINAYNAFTIKLVVDHYPVASIKDIRNGIPFVNTVWDIKFIDIEGHQYDLNNIEHGIVRKQFDEPRIHFALNCASVSCPKLLNRAYTAGQLENQLAEAAKGFLADPLRNSPEDFQFSSIFSWFRGDFKSKSGTVVKFINEYLANPIPVDARISYLDYDWRLNEKPGKS